MPHHLPRTIEKILTPPLKIQGIKTRLAEFIAANISWEGRGRWIEPFMGSGAVAFNVKPRRALLADSNRHIIEFYREIHSGRLTSEKARDFLEDRGAKLARKGGDYYYQIRDEFNQTGGSLHFLFLNRACFNGIIRFNKKGGFNVPFGHKPNRFNQSYITRIYNQISKVERIFQEGDWEFQVMDWRETLSQASKKDFVYLDPPYVGRHSDYYNSWNEEEAQELATTTSRLKCGFALSMWLENRYRKNDHLENFWQGLDRRTMEHFYHVGATAKLRNSMREALLIKPGFMAEETPLPEDAEFLTTI